MRDVLRRLLASGVLLFGLVGASSAAPRTVAPGGVPSLAPGEGLVVVAVDTTVDLDRVRISGGAARGDMTLADIRPGRTTRVFVAPAGDYRFGHVRLADRHGGHAVEADAFRVVAGRTSYPGDLVVRADGWAPPRIHLVNRGLRALDALDAEHAALAARYPMTYAGRDPDPFPEAYRNALRQGRPALSSGPSLLPPEKSAIPGLFEPSRLRAVAISPRGELVATATVDGGAWRLDLVDRRSGRTRALDTGGAPIASLAWAGARRLVVSRDDGAGDGYSVAILDIDAHGDADRRVVPRRGELVDALPADGRRILFATRDPHGALLVHRIDVSSARALAAERFDPRTRLNAGAEADLAWFTDAHGELRVALAARDDRRVLLHGSAGQFAPVLELAGNDDFVPSAVSPAGDLIYGLAEKGRAQRDLVAFDPRTRRIVDTLFSRPGVDVVAPLFDAQRRPIGVSHYRSGRLVAEYFDAANRRIGARLERHFPEHSITVLDRDAAGTTLVVAVDGSDHAPALYVYDATTDRIELVARGMPQLARATLARSTIVKATSSDGWPLEGILTLPPEPSRDGAHGYPLVVLPHGGPVGVADQRKFDPEVQFIAALGYAVLQVNFRGSEHYGRAFREAGYGAYGTGIEDDVDTVLEAALAAHPLRRDRICSVGTSYGGYSSLVAAVRRPERYRCAVSISGFTDRGLFFTASDTARTAYGRSLLEQLLGDPHANADANRVLSPVYRAADLTTPVMLAHGTEDVRVDAEHTERLARMLTLAGRPPVVVEIPGAGHTIESVTQREKLWRQVGAFLKKHLG